MNATNEVFRKSIFFTEQRWLDLQDVMQDLRIHTPSLAIEELITRHIRRNKKGSDNDRTTTKQTFRD